MALKVGDKVRVKSGAEKAKTDKGKKGVVKEDADSPNGLGVLFDGEGAVDHDYEESDLEKS